MRQVSRRAGSPSASMRVWFPSTTVVVESHADAKDGSGQPQADGTGWQGYLSDCHTSAVAIADSWALVNGGVESTGALCGYSAL